MGLGIVITTSPTSVRSDEKNFDLKVDIGIEEWEQLFLTDLEIPEPEQMRHEGSDEYLERWETSVKELMTAKEYGLLGRIWHYNRDVFYLPTEIRRLYDECSRLTRQTESELGNSMLNKLIRACDEALRVDSGIWLISD